MKTRPRIRRATLWGGAVVSAALVLLWAVSMVWSVGWSHRSVYLGVGHGSAGVTKKVPGWNGGGFESGLSRRQAEFWTAWWIRAKDDGLYQWVWIPLWMPLAVSLGVTAAAWRLEVLARRRQRAGKCASCGYDRAGLKVGAVCPECGAAHRSVGENR